MNKKIAGVIVLAFVCLVLSLYFFIATKYKVEREVMATLEDHSLLMFHDNQNIKRISIKDKTLRIDFEVNDRDDALYVMCDILKTLQKDMFVPINIENIIVIAHVRKGKPISSIKVDRSTLVSVNWIEYFTNGNFYKLSNFVDYEIY